MEDLFPGPAQPVRQRSAGAAWAIRFGPEGVTEEPGIVRHAAGYAPFADLVRGSGDDPAALAGDVPALLRFVHDRRDDLADPALAAAAGVFVGNALNASHPASTWDPDPLRTVGSGPYSFDVDAIVAAVREDATRIAQLQELLAGWDAADERERAQHEAADAVHARLAEQEPAPLPALVLPQDGTAYADDAGTPIPYGDRWPDGPPDDAYSRVSHPERFAVVHETAEALVAFLAQHFDAAVVRSVSDDGEPVVDLRPASGAPLRIALTAFPGATVRAGLLWEGRFPTCGCDACDESGDGQAAALAGAVLGVVGGGLLEERLGDPADPVWHVGLREPDGGTSSGGRDLPARADRLVEPDAVVSLGGEPWPAWPRRA